MATISKDTKVSASFTKDVCIIDPFTTTDATPSVAFSIPLDVNKSGYVIAQYNNNSSSYSSASGGNAQAVFLRSSGNISRTDVSKSKGLMATILGNFVGIQPSIDIIANTTNQTIDIEVTGKASTTITWHLEITSYISN